MNTAHAPVSQALLFSFLQILFLSYVRHVGNDVRVVFVYKPLENYRGIKSLLNKQGLSCFFSDILFLLR